MAAEYVAPGVELHHKPTPEAEKGLAFALCRIEHRQSGREVWYVLRRSATERGANRMLGAFTAGPNGYRAGQFRVWDSRTPWHAPQ